MPFKAWIFMATCLLLRGIFSKDSFNDDQYIFAKIDLSDKRQDTLEC